MLDNIEANLEDAADYVERGGVHLRNAQEKHEKNRSKSVCFLGCFAITVVVIAWYFGFFSD